MAQRNSTFERVRCIVPFCRRTRRAIASAEEEWICGGHWVAIDRVRRRTYHRLQRHARRMQLAFWTLPKGSAQRRASIRMNHRLSRIWSALKRQAIERAMGLSA